MDPIQSLKHSLSQTDESAHAGLDELEAARCSEQPHERSRFVKKSLIKHSALLLAPVFALSLSTLTGCGAPTSSTIDTPSEAFKPSTIIYRQSDTQPAKTEHAHEHSTTPGTASSASQGKDGAGLLNYQGSSASDGGESSQTAPVYDVNHNPVTAEELNNSRIERVYRHGGQYHAISSTGKEYISQENPLSHTTQHSTPSAPATPAPAAPAPIAPAKPAAPAPAEPAEPDTTHQVVAPGATDNSPEHAPAPGSTEEKPVAPDTSESTQPSEEEAAAKTLHFHGYSDRFLAGEPVSLWAHSLNSKVHSFRWTVSKADGTREVLPLTGDHYNTEFDVSYDGGSIQVESLDAEGNPLETLTKPLVVSKLGDVFISNLRDHYHTREDINPVAVSVNGDVDRFVWYLTPKGSETENKLGEGAEVHLLGGAPVNGATLRVEAYAKGKLIGSSSRKIVINDHGQATPAILKDKGFAPTADALRKLGLNDQMITSLALSQPNPAFPAGTTDAEALKHYLNNVETIDLSGVPHGLQNEALKLMPQLKRIFIQKTQVDAADIEALKKLPAYSQLVELRLNQTNIADMSFLNDLHHLEGLDITGNHVENINFVRNMPNLQKFAAGYNALEDISPLASAKKLTLLNIDGNLVSDISALQGLPLETVSINNNKVTSLDVFKGSQTLKVLSLANKVDPSLYEYKIGTNQVKDLSALDGLPKLKSLYAGYLQLKTLGWTHPLPELEDLSLATNGLKDFDTTFTPALKRIDLNYNDLRNITITQDKLGVTDFSVAHNRLTKIGWASRLQSLTTFDVSSNELVSIALDSPNYSVTTLYLDKNTLPNLEGLENWKNLDRVSATSNSLVTLDGAASDSATEIDISNNYVESLGDLSKLTHLAALVASNNHLTTIKDIKAPVLRTLVVNNDDYYLDDEFPQLNNLNTLTSLKGIENLPNLRNLVAYGNEGLTTVNDTSSATLEDLDIAEDLKDAPDAQKFPKLHYHGEPHLDEVPEDEYEDAANKRDEEFAREDATRESEAVAAETNAAEANGHTAGSEARSAKAAPKERSAAPVTKKADKTAQPQSTQGKQDAQGSGTISKDKKVTPKAQADKAQADKDAKKAQSASHDEKSSEAHAPGNVSAAHAAQSDGAEAAGTQGQH